MMFSKNSDASICKRQLQSFNRSRTTKSRETSNLTLICNYAVRTKKFKAILHTQDDPLKLLKVLILHGISFSENHITIKLESIEMSTFITP